MHLWQLYPLIGLAIGLVLFEMGLLGRDGRVSMVLLMWLWPLTLPLFIWHGISVLRWKHAARTRRDRPPLST